VLFLKLFEEVYAPLTAGLLAPFRGEVTRVQIPLGTPRFTAVTAGAPIRAGELATPGAPAFDRSL